MNTAKLKYLLSGLNPGAFRSNRCPSCAATTAEKVDRKWFHALLQCTSCGLLYRWPGDTAKEMARFYQRDYRQAGLTTDLPDEQQLARLLSTGFSRTEKDFSRVIQLFDALSLKRGSKVLDFGANWGYGVHQFIAAGYRSIGYELSVPRAVYAANLGVEVKPRWDEIEQSGPFDVVFSSHVLEHTPDPTAAICRQLDVLRPDGTFIALVPNGSAAYRAADPNGFHKLWGQVHPVMLNDEFAINLFSGWNVAVGNCSEEDRRALAGWRRNGLWRGTLDRDELLIVATREPAASG